LEEIVDVREVLPYLAGEGELVCADGLVARDQPAKERIERVVAVVASLICGTVDLECSSLILAQSKT
jgi:hypothetical protein